MNLASTCNQLVQTDDQVLWTFVTFEGSIIFWGSGLKKIPTYFLVRTPAKNDTETSSSSLKAYKGYKLIKLHFIVTSCKPENQGDCCFPQNVFIKKQSILLGWKHLDA